MPEHPSDRRSLGAGEHTGEPIRLCAEPATPAGDSLALARTSPRANRRLAPPCTQAFSHPDALETRWKCWPWKGGSRASDSRLPRPSQPPLKKRPPLGFPPPLLCFNFSPCAGTMPDNVCIFASFPMTQRGNFSPAEEKKKGEKPGASPRFCSTVRRSSAAPPVPDGSHGRLGRGRLGPAGAPPRAPRFPGSACPGSFVGRSGWPCPRSISLSPWVAVLQTEERPSLGP